MKYLKIKKHGDDNKISYYDVDNVDYIDICLAKEILTFDEMSLLNYKPNDCMVIIHFKDGRINTYGKNWLFIFE